MICPAEGCGKDMTKSEVTKVYGTSYIPGHPEPVHELIINEPVDIFVCSECHHAIIIDNKPHPTIDVPPEPKIITLS